MYQGCEIKKCPADKIVLFGLFAVSLLTAYFLTASRSDITLTEPIALESTGLSLSLPTGPGWQTQQQWEYTENAFILSSVFSPGTAGPSAFVYCRYLLACPGTPAETQLRQKAAQIGAGLEKTGRMPVRSSHLNSPQTSQNDNSLTIEWAHIKKGKTLFGMFFGIALLPNNRQLNIEVQQNIGDSDLAKRLFNKIVEGLSFEDNRLLEAGSEIVAKIKSSGLSSFLASADSQQQNEQNFFLVRDTAGNTIGFTMDTLTCGPEETPPQEPHPDIRAAGFLYMPKPFAYEQVMSFQSDNNLSTFIWKNETRSRLGRTNIEITLDGTDMLTVRKFAPRPEERIYRLNPSVLPEVFMENVLSQILDGNHTQIVTDIIRSNGTVAPMLISRIEPEEQADYVLNIDFLDGSGFGERVYFNDQKQISKILLRQKNTYILERAGIEDILREFPERAEYVLQKQ